MALPNGMSFSEAVVEYSTDGSSWTPISDETVAISHDGGDRQNDDTYVFAEDSPLTTYGKREPIETTVRAVYSEGAADIFEVVRAAYEGKTPFWIRYSPAGGSVGDFRFTSLEGRVIRCPWPDGEAGEASAILFEFVFKTSKYQKSVIA